MWGRKRLDYLCHEVEEEEQEQEEEEKKKKIFIMKETERIRVAVTLLPHIRLVVGSNLGRDTGCLWFSSVPQSSFRDSTWIRPRLLPTKYFPIYHSSTILHLDARSRDNTVGIATGHGLHDPGSFPYSTRFVLLYNIQPKSRSHPASYPVGTSSSFLGGKTAGA
jgi:hypothetical protein